jgi:hypothetical protein
MRRVIAVAAVVVVACSLSAPAVGATPTERKLQAQVKVLQRQVKALQKQVAAARVGIAATLAYEACLTAVTADAFQAIAGYPWTAEASANDYQSCTALQITRAPKTATTAVLQRLLDLFRG